MLAQDMCKSNRSWAWIFQINLKGKKNGPGLLYGPCLFRKGSRIPGYGPCLVRKGSRTVTDLVWILGSATECACWSACAAIEIADLNVV